VLARDWFGRDAWVVAPDLLNKVIAVGRPGSEWRAARIVEVEAYDQHDPASHSYPRPTPRNAVMYGPAGYVYVYFSYGMHWCANIVTGPEGGGQAVLLRAGEPLAGERSMLAARGGVARRDLCRGPARLAQALGLTGADSGASLLVAGRTVAGRSGGLGPRSAGIAVLDDGTDPPAAPLVGPRVGITKATDVAWRWCVPDSPWVSLSRAGLTGRRDRAPGRG